MGIYQLLIERKTVSPPAVLPLLLLLFALATVFLFRNDRSHFYRGPHHAHLSSQSMALAANLSPDHHFLMFFRQTLGVDGTRGYEPYNRFPIGTYALIKITTLPFADSLAKQIYAARILMLLCFAATAVLAYYALCRLVSNHWVALAATLLSFSSTYCLYYNDMISTEVTSLFGVLLTFHGMVVFVQERKFRQLIFKTCIALLLGWHIYSLLLPFTILGFVDDLIRRNASASNLSSIVATLFRARHPILGIVAFLISLSLLILNFSNQYYGTHGANTLTHLLLIIIFLLPFFTCFFLFVELVRGRLRSSVSVLTSSRYLLLGYIALAFGILVLAFNFGNEYFALERESALADLPSFQSMLWRLGLASPEFYTAVISRLDWEPFLQGQLSRIGVMSIPFYLPGYANVFAFGYGEASNGLPSVIIGTSVLVASLTGLIFVRHKILLLPLVLAGVVWVLMVRHSAYVHDFEALFYIGIPLTCFALVLLCIRRLTNDSLLVGIAVASLLIFTLSSFQMGRIGHITEAAAFHRALLTDFESIRKLTTGRRVLVLASERDTPFPWGHHAVNYYLAGSIIGYERDGYRLTDYDFVITSEREEGDSLLTPENRYIFLYETAAHRGVSSRAAVLA